MENRRRLTYNKEKSKKHGSGQFLDKKLYRREGFEFLISARIIYGIGRF